MAGLFSIVHPHACSSPFSSHIIWNIWLSIGWARQYSCSLWTPSPSPRTLSYQEIKGPHSPGWVLFYFRFSRRGFALLNMHINGFQAPNLQYFRPHGRDVGVLPLNVGYCPLSAAGREPMAMRDQCPPLKLVLLCFFSMIKCPTLYFPWWFQCHNKKGRRFWSPTLDW